jgi:von Willebrand factor type A domain
MSRAATLSVLALAALLSGASAQVQAPPPPAQSPPAATKPILPKIATKQEKSKFLRQPGDIDDPYSESIDWSVVPAWRQTSFFGVRAKGQFFVFVVDCSGSMNDDLRLYRAKTELKSTIAKLQYPQRYHVIFYNDRPRPMAGGLPVSAEPKAVGRSLAWLDTIEAEGGTDPRGAMDQALGFRPDAVFLLSDGEYPEGTDGAIAARNTEKTPVHCIDLSNGAAGDQLRRIAVDSGGRYARRAGTGLLKQ